MRSQARRHALLSDRPPLFPTYGISDLVESLLWTSLHRFRPIDNFTLDSVFGAWYAFYCIRLSKFAQQDYPEKIGSKDYGVKYNIEIQAGCFVCFGSNFCDFGGYWHRHVGYAMGMMLRSIWGKFES